MGEVTPDRDSPDGPPKSVDPTALVRLALRTVTAGFFIFSGVLLLARYTEPRTWETVLGTIESVAVVPVPEEEGFSAPGVRFRIEAAYRYPVGGTERSGTRVAMYDWIYPTRRSALAYLDRHGLRAGSRVPVYYDPQNPDNAVILKRIPWRRVEVILVVVLLWVLPTAVIGYSVVDLMRGGASRSTDSSRGRFW